MADSFYGNNDSMDITELASLNSDISDDLINQLHQQLTQNLDETAKQSESLPPIVNENDDATLFEEQTAEVSKVEENDSPDVNSSKQDALNESKAAESGSLSKSEEKKQKLDTMANFDDNFIKKYKAKLKKKSDGVQDVKDVSSTSSSKNISNSQVEDGTPIETLSNGNISEKPLSQEIKDYNDSLDFLDGNVKYSKYVIYIEPQNVDFIEKLTVKERKNLINEILKEQNDIAITKKRFKFIQTFLRHLFITILTFVISIPIIYYAVNVSLEVTINNHIKAQNNWQALYREHGKITKY